MKKRAGRLFLGVCLSLALGIGALAASGGVMDQNPFPPNDPAVFMIGHAHIDPVWRWTKEEGQSETLATFRQALARMREYPDVAFVSSSAQLYQWVAEIEPALFAEIKQRVREGRWNIVGGWWVEPDLNCPLGESLVRQGLHGQLFFEKAFGLKARIGFNPDSFGHPWTLPQILAGQDLQAYVFMRPSPWEKPDLKTPLFVWQGPDGSRIPAVQILGAYSGNEKSIESQIRDHARIFAAALPGVRTWAVFYGIGNHGGGPTIAAIEKIRALRQTSFPGIRFATLDDYAAAVLPGQKSWPVVADELQHHARGCYSVAAGVKAWNRRSEVALLSAEKAAALATALTGGSYPQERFGRAWEKVLFNQFHDILAGSAIEQAYEDARDDFGFALSEAKDISAAALQRLAWRVDTETGTNPSCTPFLVFNPHSWPSAVPMEVEMERLGRARPKLRRLRGEELPYQEIRTAGVKVGSRIRFLFQDELPSLGYAFYVMDFSETPRGTAAKRVSGGAVASSGLASIAAAGVTVGRWTLENDIVRVAFDSATGAIASYFDKQSGRELLRAQAAVPIVLEDQDDTWGHRTKSYDQEAGRFGKAEFRVVEEGPERGRIQVRTVYGDSAVTQDFGLGRGRPELTVRVTVDWHEYYKVLKLGFPTVLASGEAAFSIPYGFIRRPMNGEEEPVQTWLDLGGRDERGPFGFALFSDSKGGADVKNGEIRLTVLHSTAWSHHIPASVSLDEGYRLIDTGIHEFSYALLPHAGEEGKAAVARKADAFLMAPLVLLTDRHPGDPASAASLVSVSTPGAAVTALKMAERAPALALRLVELDGRTCEGTLRLAFRDKPIPFRLRPFEIATFLVPLDTSAPVRQTNLLEEDQS